MSEAKGIAEANVALMEKAVAALNARDFDTCTALMTADFAINLAGAPEKQHGVDAWRQNVETLLGAFPDARLHVEDIFAAGDKVAVRAYLTGTHSGPFLGIPATGRQIRYDSNELYRIADGKIAEEWICSDMLTLMMQIGAVPAPH